MTMPHETKEDTMTHKRERDNHVSAVFTFPANYSKIQEAWEWTAKRVVITDTADPFLAKYILNQA